MNITIFKDQFYLLSERDKFTRTALDGILDKIIGVKIFSPEMEKLISLAGELLKDVQSYRERTINSISTYIKLSSTKLNLKNRLLNNVDTLFKQYKDSFNRLELTVNELIGKEIEFSKKLENKANLDYYPQIKILNITQNLIDSTTENKSYKMLLMIFFSSKLKELKIQSENIKHIFNFSYTDEEVLGQNLIRENFDLANDNYMQILIDSAITSSIQLKISTKINKYKNKDPNNLPNPENPEFENYLKEIAILLNPFCKSAENEFIAIETPQPQEPDLIEGGGSKEQLPTKQTQTLEELIEFAFFKNSNPDYTEDRRVKRWNGFLTPDRILANQKKFNGYDGDVTYLEEKILEHSGEGLIKLINSSELLDLFGNCRANIITFNGCLILHPKGEEEPKKIFGIFTFVIGENNKIYHRDFKKQACLYLEEANAQDNHLDPDLSALADEDFEDVSDIKPQVLENGNLSISYSNHSLLQSCIIFKKPKF